MNCSKPKLVIALFSLVLAATLVGCKDEGSIRVYNVPKLTNPENAAANTGRGSHTGHNHPGHNHGDITVRMVGAIIPRADRVWFFKAMAPEPLIKAEVETIRQLIENVKFVANVGGDESEPRELPQWELPKGWTNAGKSGMRYDTITIGSAAHPIELTVTPLGPGSGDVTANVQRWAGQVGVNNPSTSQLASYTEAIRVAGQPATFVNIPGTGGDGSMASRQPPQNPNGNPARRPTGDPLKVRYKTPAGWEEQKAGGMRLAAFTVKAGDAVAEVTVIPLPMAAAEAASPIANINRWRGQVSLQPLTQKEILEDLEADDLGETPKYVRIIEIDKQQALLTDMTAPESASPRERIIGVLHPIPEIGYIYFYKMKGPADLVGANKDKFLALLQSVAYEP